MKKRLFKGKLSHSGSEVIGQLIYIDGDPHIIQDGDLEMDGHHIRQISDVPTWVDEDSIKEV